MYIHSHQTTPPAGSAEATAPSRSVYRLPADRKWHVRHSRWYLPAVLGVLAILFIPGGAFTQTGRTASMSAGSPNSNGAGPGAAAATTSTSAGATTGTSGGSAATSSGVGASGTLRSVGTTANGSPAGTSGTDPGVSSSQSATAGTPAATSGTTLRPVGVNVDGSVAGSTGTDPGSQTLNNPLNRNPANRPTVPDAAPATDANNSTTRPTLGAVTRPDGRDTMVTPDPSRDSTTTR